VGSRAPILFLLAVAGSQVVACMQTTVTVVMGPDGGKALLIEAPDQRDALTKAHEECPDGYEILTLSTSVEAQMLHTTRELLIRCKHAEWSAASAEPVDPHPCKSAAGELDDFVDYWADVAHAEAVDKRPPNADFLELCEKMPSGLKPCFKKGYRKAHEKFCSGLFGRLDEPRRTALDTMFTRKTK
jgi:hypothetical protein